MLCFPLYLNRRSDFLTKFKQVREFIGVGKKFSELCILVAVAGTLLLMSAHDCIVRIVGFNFLKIVDDYLGTRVPTYGRNTALKASYRSASTRES